MKFDNLRISLCAAAVIGLAQMFVLQLFWVALTLNVPYVNWLVTHGLTGPPLRVVLFAFDNLVNLGLFLPAAFALRALRPRKVFLYLAVAILPGLLWQYRLVFSDSSIFVANWSMFIPGLLTAALTLPLAVLIVHIIATRRMGAPGAVA